MLDGIQMFFILTSVLLFVILFERRRVLAWQYGALGVLVGLAVNVKVNAPILLLFFPALYLLEHWTRLSRGAWRARVGSVKDLPLKAALSLLGRYHTRLESHPLVRAEFAHRRESHPRTHPRHRVLAPA